MRLASITESIAMNMHMREIGAFTATGSITASGDVTVAGNATAIKVVAMSLPLTVQQF